MSPPLIFKLRIIAILLVAVGYGWAGGHFIPPNSPAVAYLFQAVVILILLVLGLSFFAGNTAYKPARWSVNGLTIFTALSSIINIANIIRGINNTSAFGSHNTLADLVPICILITGCLLWLYALLPALNRKK